jgi:hypothetical protein
MPDLVDLEVNEYEAAQDAVVEDQVNLVVGVIDCYAVLPADEGEALASSHYTQLIKHEPPAPI